MGGSNELEGRVELCQSNAWGRVCDYSWDFHDARVVCRQLGYSAAGLCRDQLQVAMVYVNYYLHPAVSTSGSHFGRGSGSVILNLVNCHGHEDGLVNCSSGTIYSACTRYVREAGVICRRRSGIKLIIKYIHGCSLYSSW